MTDTQDYTDCSDGCDVHGFPGGCARAGHTPATCPSRPADAIPLDAGD